MGHINYFHNQSQNQNLNSYLTQYFNILKLSSIELRDKVIQELNSNPVLEELPYNISDNNINKYNSSNYIYTNKENNLLNLPYANTISFEKHLKQQLLLRISDKKTLEILNFLIENLDYRGFLTDSLIKIQKKSKYNIKELEAGIKILKTFNPIGVGSLSFKDLLLYQLKYFNNNCLICFEIIQKYYNLFLNRKINELSKKIKVPIDTINKCFLFIKSLNFDLTKDFREDTNYVILPDLKIEHKEGDWTIASSFDCIPKFKINYRYEELIKANQLNISEYKYLKSKIDSGNNLMNLIFKRKITLEKIALQILKFQKKFFQNGTSYLIPMSVKNIAKNIKVHETTVNRAITDKFIETPYGVFPMRYFFSIGCFNKDKENISNTIIKNKILSIIKEEKQLSPYSDQDILNILQKENINVSRRTINKYRNILGIKVASIRKNFN